MKSKNVCLIGMFPPPLHGMSLINEYVRRHICVSATPLVIDYSPRDLDRSFRVRFGKIFRVGRCVLELIVYLSGGRVGAVYMGLSGGNGQVYDAVFVTIGRLFGRKLYLHHHSYLYLIRPRWITKILLAIAGKNAVHIVACENMAGDLRLKYTVVNNIRIISGIAALAAWEGAVRERSKIKSIGFLSNISVEKGILEFLDVAAWADRSGWPLHFYLAGPFHDEVVRRLVEKRLTTLRNVTCVGAVYGDDKKDFFDSIDVFLLPSHNESEGLVIHEAMSRGVPVIAYSRGCIEQIVSDEVGLVVAPEQDYVSVTVGQIKEWLSDPVLFQLASQAARNRFNEARSLHIEKMDALCTELAGQNWIIDEA